MRKSTLLIIILAASQMGATNCGQVLRDPGFDLWCGQDLCAWKLERGDVQRVATWNEGDAGVELVGDDVAIEQLSPVTSDDDTCIQFDLVANIDETAEVYLDVDIQGDGTLEMHERLPTSHWDPLTYNIHIKPPYDGIRFQLTKQGPGHAVLANIGAATARDKCAGLSELDPGPRRDGARCTTGPECASGICTGLVCEGCMSGSCSTGQTCGVGDPFSPVFDVPTECVANASKELGERCIDSAECVSGGCFVLGSVGVCSSCYNSDSCPVGQTCGSAWDGGPVVCGAGQHVVAPGAPCGRDDDCASGHCNGSARMQCDDGRECSSAAQCPFADGLKNGPCNTVGIQGGTCQ